MAGRPMVAGWDTTRAVDESAEKWSWISCLNSLTMVSIPMSMPMYSIVMKIGVAAAAMMRKLALSANVKPCWTVMSSTRW
eukprot:scaffold88042_cov43-Tisochrysis_lutea.AAC.3